MKRVLFALLALAPVGAFELGCVSRSGRGAAEAHAESGVVPLPCPFPFSGAAGACQLPGCPALDLSGTVARCVSKAEVRTAFEQAGGLGRNGVVCATRDHFKNPVQLVAGVEQPGVKCIERPVWTAAASVNLGASGDVRHPAPFFNALLGAHGENVCALAGLRQPSHGPLRLVLRLQFPEQEISRAFLRVDGPSEEGALAAGLERSFAPQVAVLRGAGGLSDTTQVEATVDCAAAVGRSAVHVGYE